MENYEEKLLEKIDSDVRSNAELVAKRVNDETEYMLEEEVGFYKQSLKKETDTYLESELNDLRLQSATRTSQAKLDIKKKLLTKREDLTDQLFDTVRGDLIAYAKSDNYENYLKKHLARITVSDNGYFVVRENDVDLMKKLLKEENISQPVKTGYFAIGGFRYVDEENRSEYSCVMEDSLKDAREWFRDHSGFKVESEDRK